MTKRKKKIKHVEPEEKVVLKSYTLRLKGSDVEKLKTKHGNMSLAIRDLIRKEVM